ncbi:MAG: hypothetical protein ACQERZ_03520 [Fusobacteriota bacterium]
MKILNRCLLFFILINISYSQVIDFSIVTMGNLKGEYKELSNIYTALEKAKVLREDIIKINTGNNLVGFKEIDDIYISFYHDIQADFNFYALGEYLADANKKYDFEFSSLNIKQENVLDYKIIDKLEYKIAAIGLTDIYDYEDGLDYDKQLEKVIFNVEEYVDFIFVVSDLRRAVNVNILEKYKEVSILFESGRCELEQDKIEINNNYLIPNGMFKITDVSYNSKESKEVNKYNDQNLLKRVKIENVYNIKNIKEYTANQMVEDYISKKEKEIIKRNNEIIGYNVQTFDKEETLFSNDIEYIKDLGFRLIDYYKADIAIIPAFNIKTGLEKGLYSIEDVNKLFTNDKLIEISITQEKLDELNQKSQNNQGTQEFLHIIKNRYQFESKKEYDIITTEGISKEYDINYDKIKKINLKDFELIRR